MAVVRCGTHIGNILLVVLLLHTANVTHIVTPAAEGENGSRGNKPVNLNHQDDLICFSLIKSL